MKALLVVALVVAVTALASEGSSASATASATIVESVQLTETDGGTEAHFTAETTSFTFDADAGVLHVE